MKTMRFGTLAILAIASLLGAACGKDVNVDFQADCQGGRGTHRDNPLVEEKSAPPEGLIAKGIEAEDLLALRNQGGCGGGSVRLHRPTAAAGRCQYRCRAYRAKRCRLPQRATRLKAALPVPC